MNHICSPNYVSMTQLNAMNELMSNTFFLRLPLNLQFNEDYDATANLH
ncbi:hypothetical protein THF1C08_30279 [Vibrio jasicida]|uniref:Uncharacterized protein n=1 Tax=Vibrio jasicida TaxID=766224 RepID=A0AAU9QR73_9VIBR|nr:hypothetical protein THF1C08_30279 [Vibrio jasicida]CAH1599468.1 hypothetical protein THF1A12_40155 [Vibrio jasicida]